MRKTALAITLFALTCVASAQEQTRIDFSVSGAGVFSKTVSSYNGRVSDNPTNSLAFLVSFRFHMKSKHALEFNIGHTRNSQMFSVPPDTFRVMSAITEISGAYVFSPISKGKFQWFLLAGGGGLRFSPGNTYVDTFTASFGAAQQTSLALLYGGGVDYRLWRRLALRLQYRGLLYKNPDFDLPGLFFTGAKGHMAEPALGIVLNF
jgi:hypothetical protein